MGRSIRAVGVGPNYFPLRFLHPGRPTGAPGQGRRPIRPTDGTTLGSTADIPRPTEGPPESEVRRLRWYRPCHHLLGLSDLHAQLRDIHLCGFGQKWISRMVAY